MSLSVRKLCAFGAVLLFWSAVMLLPSSLPADERIYHALEQPTSQNIQSAKELYAQQMADIESDAARMIDEALQTARAKADEMKRQKSQAAREKLLAAYDAAVDLALQASDLQAASRLTAEKQSLEGLSLPSSAINPDELDDHALYRSMLGRYAQREGRLHAVVNLAVPNKDLWSEKIQARLRGQINFDEIEYRGDASLIIPADGTFNFDFPFHTQVQLNGKELSAGETALKKGAYAVHFVVGTHGGAYILDSYLRVTSNETKQELPLVNSGADIKRFLAKPIGSRPVVDVSAKRPETVERPTPKTDEAFQTLKPDGLHSLLKN